MPYVFRRPYDYALRAALRRSVTTKAPPPAQTVVLTQPEETDLAQPVTVLMSPAVKRLDFWRRGEPLGGQQGKVDNLGLDYTRRGATLPYLIERPAVAAQTVALTQPSETDLAQPVTALKTATLGQASEADTAQTNTSLKTVTLGQAAETDLAQTQQATQKTVTLGQAAETDTAQTVTHLKTVTLGQAETASTAQPVTALLAKTVVLGQATETDLAQPASRVPALGQASETDTAQPVTALKTKAVGQAEETDTAQPVVSPKTVAIGQASETDTAQPLSPSATVPHLDFWRRGEPLGGQQGATDNLGLEFYRRAEPLGYLITRAVVVHTVALTQPSETELAQPVTPLKTVTLGQCTETELAQPVTVLKAKEIGQAFSGETCGASGYGGDWGTDWGSGSGIVDIGVQPLLTTSGQTISGKLLLIGVGT